MRNIIVLSFMVFGFAFTSCNSTENQAESKQSAYSESMDTSEGTEIKEKNSEEKIDEYSEEEDGFEVDSETLSKMDSAANASMEFEPIVANRAAVEKSLKPNKDGVIVLDWNIMNDIKLNECFNETVKISNSIVWPGSMVRAIPLGDQTPQHIGLLRSIKHD